MMSPCGFFCTFQLALVYAWPVITFVLIAAALTGFLWQSLRFRRRLIDVSLALLVLHLGHLAYLFLRY